MTLKNSWLIRSYQKESTTIFISKFSKKLKYKVKESVRKLDYGLLLQPGMPNIHTSTSNSFNLTIYAALTKKDM